MLLSEVNGGLSHDIGAQALAVPLGLGGFSEHQSALSRFPFFSRQDSAARDAQQQVPHTLLQNQGESCRCRVLISEIKENPNRLGCMYIYIYICI